MDRVALTRALLERGELSEPVRLRIALDVLATLDPDGASCAERSPSSRLHLANIGISWSGSASLDAGGDDTGVAVLLWEILAGRAATSPRPPRLHDLLDEIHPDVDEMIGRALAGRWGRVEEVREALEFAADGRAAAPGEVAAELGPVSALPPPRPLSVQAQEALRASSAQPVKRATSAPPARRASSASPAKSASSTPPRAPAPTAAVLALRPPPRDLVEARHPPSDREPISTELAPLSVRGTILLVSMLEDEDGELAEGLRMQGYNVVVVVDAESGFEATCQLEPACVVCDMDLPDDAGDTVVRRLRKLDSSVATTPFVLIASATTTSDRIARFAAGADICLLKPYASSDVVAQVLALDQMSARLRKTRAQLSRFPKASSRAFNGSLEQISLAAILTIVEMERRSGVFQVRQDMLAADLWIIGGYATHGIVQSGRATVIDTLLAMTGMERGRFSFVAREGFAPVPEHAIQLGHALAEATRLHDEAQKPDS